MDPKKLEKAETVLLKMRERKEEISALLADLKEEIPVLKRAIEDEDFEVSIDKTKQRVGNRREKLVVAKLAQTNLMIEDYDLTRKIARQMDKIKQMRSRPND